jgi:hypothetical protein
MGEWTGLGLDRPTLDAAAPATTEHVVVQKALQRVLAFTGYTLDDVLNDPIARNHVAGYYKLYRQVQRRCQAVDLDRWWNGLSSHAPQP